MSLQKSLQHAADSFEETLRAWFVACHSYLSHVPIDKYAPTVAVPLPDLEACRRCPQGLPIPPDHLLQKFSEDVFLASGSRDVETMLGVLSEQTVPLCAGERILDFGCSSGRMIRWLYPFADSCEIWGVDVNANNLMWCRNHLSPPFKFSCSTRLPHLPFEDRHFNFIYAGSVFTHIDELYDTWLLELRRILAPGGRLYLTFHDNHTVQALKDEYPEHWFHDCMRGSQMLADKFDEYAAGDFAMFSILRSNAPHLNLETTPNVYFDREYLLRLLSTFFEVRAVKENAYGYQTAVLLIRPE
ncbi:MAG: class I SAM-dependent methyltransferase [Bdellovibrionales bacterium]|nr:class I SAM-dependent methyltransferase [Bdellovibrionales bacterium]